MSSDLFARGTLIRAVSSNLTLLHVLFPSWPGCGASPLSYWFPGLA
jgi:hypothetical protein